MNRFDWYLNAKRLYAKNGIHPSILSLVVYKVFKAKDLFDVNEDDFKSNIEMLDYYNQKIFEKKQLPQHIVGYENFYGYFFNVSKYTLLPRIETECLIDIAQDKLKTMNSNPKVLDLCCGSGCIGITIAKKFNVISYASDISQEALDIARRNYEEHNITCTLKISDIFQEWDEKFDLILCNPPYIDIEDEIEKSVIIHEPHLALFAEDKGLYFYKNIIEHLSLYLNTHGVLVFEIGESQGQLIEEYASIYDYDCSIIKDMFGRNRNAILTRRQGVCK